MKKLILTAFVLLGLVFVTQAQKHYIGEKFGGGIVFKVSADGLHGLIVETKVKDQADNRDNEEASIEDPENHSEAGKAFTDWRLPKRSELIILYRMREKLIGFQECNYLCSEREGLGQPVTLWFGKGKNYSVTSFYQVRTIRDF